MPSRKGQFRSDLLGWAETHLRNFPWRDCSLSVYEVFVAEFFLTQTPAENTAKIYPEFLAQYPSLEHIRQVPEAELAQAIEPLGFQNQRAEALSEIATRYDEVPIDRDELLSLPLVGPYVANATLCFAKSERLPILDRNVIRVYDRVFGDEFPGATERRREFAVEMLPSDKEVARKYNLALLDLGTLVCEKRDPQCRDCFAREYCSYYRSEVDGS